MRYAFVFASIVSVWIAMILLAAFTHINALFLVSVVIVMTVILFLIGFHRGR